METDAEWKTGVGCSPEMVEVGGGVQLAVGLDAFGPEKEGKKPKSGLEFFVQNLEVNT